MVRWQWIARLGRDGGWRVVVIVLVGVEGGGVGTVGLWLVGAGIEGRGVAVGDDMVLLRGALSRDASGGGHSGFERC